VLQVWGLYPGVIQGYSTSSRHRMLELVSLAVPYFQYWFTLLCICVILTFIFVDCNCRISAGRRGSNGGCTRRLLTFGRYKIFFKIDCVFS